MLRSAICTTAILALGAVTAAPAHAQFGGGGLESCPALPSGFCIGENFDAGDTDATHVTAIRVTVTSIELTRDDGATVTVGDGNIEMELTGFSFSGPGSGDTYGSGLEVPVGSYTGLEIRVARNAEIRGTNLYDGAFWCRTLSSGGDYTATGSAGFQAINMDLTQFPGYYDMSPFQVTQTGSELIFSASSSEPFFTLSEGDNENLDFTVVLGGPIFYYSGPGPDCDGSQTTWLPQFSFFGLGGGGPPPP